LLRQPGQQKVLGKATIDRSHLSKVLSKVLPEYILQILLYSIDFAEKKKL
jgi:hypothetical protein